MSGSVAWREVAVALVGLAGVMAVSAPVRVRAWGEGEPADGSGDGSGVGQGDPREPGGTSEPAPATPGPVNLFPRVPMAPAAGWILPPEPEPDAHEERSERALEHYFDDALSQDRLASGGVNGWYYQMQRAMRKAWRPDMRALERERRSGMNVGEVVVDELRRYAQPPFDPPPLHAIPPPEISSLPREDQAALRAMEAQSFLFAPVTWYRVELRVVQSPEGVVHAAWVTRSSGYQTLDEGALDAVRRGLVRIPAPPGAVVGDRQVIASEWSLEAGDVATYMNQAGCVDDPVHDEYQCAALGRGIVRTRIALLRVVDATHATFEERRATQRADPSRIRP